VPPALYVSPYAAGLPRTPYLTLPEFKAAPTNVDTTDLVPGGTQAQQDDALTQVIARASSEMDKHVHYVLAATVDTDQRRARIRLDGTVRLPLRGLPLLELDSFLVGPTPSMLQAITPGQAEIWHQDNVLEVQVATAAFVSSWSRVYCRYTYVNGYPNTMLAASANSGVSSITVVNSLGLYAGAQFTVYDLGGGSEVLQVAGSYAGGAGASTTIPLASATTLTHTVTAANPVSVSALPPAVKDACIHWTAGLIKTSGGGALEMDTVEQPKPDKTDSGEGGGLEDIAMAEAMLATFVLPSYG